MFIAAVSRQNLETTKTSIKGKGTTVVYLYTRILLSRKKKGTTFNSVCVSHRLNEDKKKNTYNTCVTHVYKIPENAN